MKLHPIRLAKKVWKKVDIDKHPVIVFNSIKGVVLVLAGAGLFLAEEIERSLVVGSTAVVVVVFVLLTALENDKVGCLIRSARKDE